jgi:large subunit ribosomal protein L15
MQLHDILEKADSKEPKKRRIGRGNGNGKGTYCGRGVKGQKARTGFGFREFFSGGETPIIKRIPKHGFNNAFSTEYAVVNVEELNIFDDGEEVGPDRLEETGLVRPDEGQPVKVLGDGSLDTELTVEADAFSDSAREKIEGAGGTVSITD